MSVEQSGVRSQGAGRICTLLLAGALFLSLVVYACVPAKAPWRQDKREKRSGVSPWPMPHGDAANSGRSVAVGPARPIRRWLSRAVKVASAPVIGTDGTVLVGGLGNKLLALYPDGTKKWALNLTSRKAPLRMWQLVSPAVGRDGTIYVSLGWTGTVQALTPNGRKKWESKPVDIAISSPIVAPDGTIYVGGTGWSVHALQPDGTKKWALKADLTKELKGEFSGVVPSLAVGSDGTVYAGSIDGNLYAVTPSGRKRWSFATNGMLVSPPVVGVDGTVYVGSYDGNLYAVRPNGTKKWNFKTKGPVVGWPAAGRDGTVYLGSADGRLYALNAGGAVTWSFAPEGGLGSSPVIDGRGAIYVGSDSGRLYSLTPDGKRRWEISIGVRGGPSPAIGRHHVIYCGNFGGALAAVAER